MLSRKSLRLLVQNAWAHMWEGVDMYQNGIFGQSLSKQKRKKNCFEPLFSHETLATSLKNQWKEWTTVDFASNELQGTKDFVLYKQNFFRFGQK